MIVEGIKKELVGAFQQAFSDTFWSSFNVASSRIDPKRIVLMEYPTEKIEFPMVRIGVDVEGLFWDNISAVTDTKDNQCMQVNGSCSIDAYALSAQSRDRLLDAFLALLTWRKLQIPNAFDNYLTETPKKNLEMPVIKLSNGDIDISTGDEEVLEWAENGGRVYMASISVPFIATQGQIPTQYADIIKTVDKDWKLNA